jgi:hypothetical protein
LQNIQWILKSVRRSKVNRSEEKIPSGTDMKR